MVPLFSLPTCVCAIDLTERESGHSVLYENNTSCIACQDVFICLYTICFHVSNSLCVYEYITFIGKTVKNVLSPLSIIFICVGVAPSPSLLYVCVACLHVYIGLTAGIIHGHSIFSWQQYIHLCVLSAFVHKPMILCVLLSVPAWKYHFSWQRSSQQRSEVLKSWLFIKLLREMFEL